MMQAHHPSSPGMLHPHQAAPQPGHSVTNGYPMQQGHSKDPYQALAMQNEKIWCTLGRWPVRVER